MIFVKFSTCRRPSHPRKTRSSNETSASLWGVWLRKWLVCFYSYIYAIFFLKIQLILNNSCLKFPVLVAYFHMLIYFKIHNFRTVKKITQNIWYSVASIWTRRPFCDLKKNHCDFVIFIWPSYRWNFDKSSVLFQKIKCSWPILLTSVWQNNLLSSCIYCFLVNCPLAQIRAPDWLWWWMTMMMMMKGTRLPMNKCLIS